MIDSASVVFADTAFWIALVVRRDQYHAIAQACVDRMTGQITTTDAVLLETANALSPLLLRKHAVRLVTRLRQQSEVEIVAFDDPLMQRAWQMYCNCADKSWSLTDCISFIVMHDRNIRSALTSNHHFEQAGFQILLCDDRP